MQVKIKRIDTTIPLPVHKTPGAVAIDLSSRIDMDILPGQIAYVPMNVVIKIPEGYFILLAPRSSTHKLGIQGINGVGIMDRDYCGDQDEYHFSVRNFTQNPVHVNKGDRLCQLVLIKCETFDLVEVDSMATPSRGGFGTTGVK